MDAFPFQNSFWIRLILVKFWGLKIDFQKLRLIWNCFEKLFTLSKHLIKNLCSLCSINKISKIKLVISLTIYYHEATVWNEPNFVCFAYFGTSLAVTPCITDYLNLPLANQTQWSIFSRSFRAGSLSWCWWIRLSPVICIGRFR